MSYWWSSPWLPGNQALPASLSWLRIDTYYSMFAPLQAALQNLQLISAKSLLYYVTGMSCMRSCLPILIPIVVTVGGPCRVYVQ